MSKIVLAHPEAHEKLTGRLFYKRTTESGYVDAGNVKEYVNATTRTLVTRTRATKGSRHVNDEQVDVNHEAFTFLLDEREAESEKLLSVAKANSDSSQAATEGATATITNVTVGRWYPVGVYNLANVGVTSSLAGDLVEGTDYELDSENGRIKVLSGGHVGNGESLVLTFDQPSITFESFETQYDPLFYCDVIIEEYNQFNGLFLRKHTGRGYINVTEFPTQSGEFGTFRVKFTPSGPMTTLKRPTSETTNTHAETAEAAGLSSSSSNSSSSSS